MSPLNPSRRENRPVRLGWAEHHGLTPAEQRALSRSAPLRPAEFHARERTTKTPHRFAVARAR
jgi:hypothetical protein